ncbi:hypothetical protein [Paenalcaligenes faecalis]|uniref:hypothetical protein n=1 Tax=Paenalcaligenes faecalis TaxID=2980099 RepID=UPI0022B9A062|nr:hypothetical protein [Paenalcaligenes faecalis]
MSNIFMLISAINPFLPFKSESDAQAFLNGYGLADQCAFISALYIGRDHLHSNGLNHDYVNANGTPIIPIDRYHATGMSCELIHQKNFARILYEKNTILSNYYASFLKCIPHQYLITF